MAIKILNNVVISNSGQLANITSIDSTTTNTFTSALAPYEIGDIRTSYKTLAAPTWLPSDRSIYLKASYPELANVLGSSAPEVRIADPDVQPPGSPSGVALSSDGTYLASSHSSSPYMAIYKRVGDTVTKLTNPVTTPPNDSFCVGFSSDDTYLAYGHSSSPFITIYKRSGDTFTKLANPAVLPAAAVTSLVFTNTHLILGTTSGINVYFREGDTYTRIPNPTNSTANTADAVAVAGSIVAAIKRSSGTQYSVLHLYHQSVNTFTYLSSINAANVLSRPSGVSTNCSFLVGGGNSFIAGFSSGTGWSTLYPVPSRAIPVRFNLVGNSCQVAEHIIDPFTDTTTSAAITADGKFFAIPSTTSTPGPVYIYRTGNKESTIETILDVNNIPGLGEAYSSAFSGDANFYVLGVPRDSGSGNRLQIFKSVDNVTTQFRTATGKTNEYIKAT